MSSDERINDLLRQWQEGRRQGQTPTAEELCRACPEHAEELRRLIEGAEGLPAADPWATTAREPGAARDRAGGTECPPVAGYEVLGELGRGGMGVVYRARQPGAGRVVALKMLAGAYLQPHEVERFRREARLLGSLQHPNIVQVYEVGEAGGRPFFSMELVPGGSLKQRLGGRPVPAPEAARLVEALARAVHAAHCKGILHRDLKPSNVLLASGPEEGLGDCVVKVGDFGLAKDLEGDAGQTPTGVILGTPSYMAPEQAGGRKGLTPAADVYSLGAILYECLTGRPPFRADTPLATVTEVLTREPPPPRSLRPGLPRDLEIVCLKCLCKDPARRYATALDLADELVRWRRGELTWRPPGPGRRAWHFVRKNPGKCLTLLLLAAVIASLAVVYLADPKRRLGAARRRLARGETVTWLGEDGPPLWSDCVAGRDQAVLAAGRGEPFAVSTLSTALVEFVPDVPLPRCRVRAWVRHVDGAVVSRVGLYLGRRAYQTPAGTEHYFWELSFSDRLPGGKRLPLSLDLRRLSVPPPREHAQRRLASGFPRPGPGDAPGGPGWHEIVVDVTPEGVRAWEDGQDRGEVRVATLAGPVRAWLANHGHAGVGEVVLPTGGGLGLLVEGGAGQFRSVTVGPLPERQ